MGLCTLDDRTVSSYSSIQQSVELLFLFGPRNSRRTFRVEASQTAKMARVVQLKTTRGELSPEHTATKLSLMKRLCHFGWHNQSRKQRQPDFFPFLSSIYHHQSWLILIKSPESDQSEAETTAGIAEITYAFPQWQFVHFKFVHLNLYWVWPTSTLLKARSLFMRHKVTLL